MSESDNQTEQKRFKNMTFKERKLYIKELITVEPLVACYVTASYLCEPALNNLKLEQSCKMDAGFNDTVCDAILTESHIQYKEHNHIVQSHIIDMHSWNQPMQSIIPLIILMTFLGSYSDKYKVRKPFLLIPLIGKLVGIVGCMFSVYYMRTWSIITLGLLQTVLPSFFGGSSVLVMAVFSYIADISSLEMRTLRVGIVQIVLSLCDSIVQSFAGILFEKIGYYGIFSIAFVIQLIGLLYGIFFIHESPKEIDRSERKNVCAEIFDFKHILNTFSILFKKSPGNNRKSIIIIMIVITITLAIDSGEFSIMFLYTQEVLQWTVVKFAYFMTFISIVFLIGTAVGLPLFTNYLKFGDFPIIVISMFDKIIANIVAIFSSSSVILYAASIVGMLHGITSIIIRSLATKVVSPDDIGKAQSLFSVCEAIGPSIAFPIYNKLIYEKTISTFPSTFFMVGAVLMCFCLLLMIFMFKSTKTMSNKTDVEVDERPEMEKFIEARKADTNV